MDILMPKVLLKVISQPGINKEKIPYMKARFVLEFAANVKDKYYANSTVIETLYQAIVDNIPLEEVTEIVEPAAGDLALKPIIEKLAEPYGIPTRYYDLYPDTPEITQMDYYRTELRYKPGRLVVTGPPYSGQNWLRFAKKSAEIADWVAFISPHSFLDTKNPVPELELLDQIDLGLQDFSGSSVYDGRKSHPVKTAILIYKRVDPVSDPLIARVERDFRFKQFSRGKPKGDFDYFISRQGYNAGTVSDDPEDFFSSIGIKVLNNSMRDPLGDFLSRFKEEYDQLFTKYSPTTKKTISTARLKQWIADELYNSLDESVSFERGVDPKRSLGLGSATWETLARGDVLQAMKEVSFNSYGELTNSNYGTIYDDMYIKLTAVRHHPPYMDIGLVGFWDLEAIKEDRIFLPYMSLKGTLRQFKNRFRIVSRQELREG
jgi:hypothetical protein